MENSFFEVSMNTKYWRRNLDTRVTGRQVKVQVSIFVLANK